MRIPRRSAPRIVLAVVPALLLGGCGLPPSSAPPDAATMPAVPAAASPTASPSPPPMPRSARTAAPATASATPPPPRPSPAPSPTSTTAPIPPPQGSSGVGSRLIAFSGTLEPRVLRVGQELRVTLTLTNRGSVPIRGLSVESRGPWQAFTLTSIRPNGQLRAGRDRAIFELPAQIDPGGVVRVEIFVAPDELGNYAFRFSPRELESGEPLLAESGETPTVGAEVAVIR